MRKIKNRKVGHWKRWGWSLTYSECGYCGALIGDYCPRCGARMSDPEEWWCPPLPELKPLTLYICKNCGKEIINPQKYCQYCGAEVEMESENERN